MTVNLLHEMLILFSFLMYLEGWVRASMCDLEDLWLNFARKNRIVARIQKFQL